MQELYVARKDAKNAKDFSLYLLSDLCVLARNRK